jgi:phosphatidylglycerophosphate synthase
MTAVRTLALVPPAEGEPAAVPPETAVLGLPIIRRAALAAKRAGFDRVVVSGASADGPAARALEGSGAEFLPAGSPAPEGSALLPWNTVVAPRDLADLPAGRQSPPPGVVVAAPADIPRAEKWLLAGLLKENEGFMSRHFERKISLAFSRRLAATSITPNQMTLASAAVGLAGAPFFLSPRPLLQTVGALLFLLHSILDGCDGELARLKYSESRLGGVLDFWGDNVVHSAVFSAIAVGWSVSAHAAWPLLLGALAVAGTLASAGYAYRISRAGWKAGPLFTTLTAADTRFSRLIDALARRDFIYLVLALSLFGKARWFLLLSAVGAPAYFFALFALGRRNPEGRRNE